MWLNGTAAPQQRLFVNITNLTANGDTAACASPPWPLQGVPSLAVVMQLIWSDGAFLEVRPPVPCHYLLFSCAACGVQQSSQLCRADICIRGSEI